MPIFNNEKAMRRLKQLASQERTLDQDNLSDIVVLTKQCIDWKLKRIEIIKIKREQILKAQAYSLQLKSYQDSRREEFLTPYKRHRDEISKIKEKFNLRSRTLADHIQVRSKEKESKSRTVEFLKTQAESDINRMSKQRKKSRVLNLDSRRPNALKIAIETCLNPKQDVSEKIPKQEEPALVRDVKSFRPIIRPGEKKNRWDLI